MSVASKESSKTTHCRNCGTEVVGAFCQKCGQKHLSSGLDAGEIASELMDSVVRLDSRLWHTVIGLTKNPGRVALDYAEGKRARYVNPVRYCFACIALSIATMLATGELEAFNESIMRLTGGESDKQRVDQFFATFVQYLNLMSLLSVPVFAFAVRWLFLKSGRNYAECLAFSCFILGHGALLGVLATFFNAYVYFLSIWPAAIINTVIPIYASMVFFKRRFFAVCFLVSIAFCAYLLVPIAVSLILLP